MLVARQVGCRPAITEIDDLTLDRPHIGESTLFEQCA
jgi:hypothetical protein